MKRHLTNDDHLTNEEMVNQLYGVGDPAGRLHLAGCVACTGRYACFERKRAEMAAGSASDIAPSVLAAQRRAVYTRLSEMPRKQTHWMPAVAAAALLAVGMFLYRPSTPVVSRPALPAHADLSDDQLFSDVYSIEESDEPRAAAPIQGLFETASKTSLDDDGQN